MPYVYCTITVSRAPRGKGRKPRYVPHHFFILRYPGREECGSSAAGLNGVQPERWSDRGRKHALPFLWHKILQRPEEVRYPNFRLKIVADACGADASQCNVRAVPTFVRLPEYY